MAPRHLINEDGSPFDDGELEALSVDLDDLPIAERVKFRNENASAIAQHSSKQILIVAGPGTGKSTLFKQRILNWLGQSPNARILGLSFVRKLVGDLNSDVKNDKGLTNDQKSQVDIYTLHKYARSVVEQNHGTREWGFARHFRIIGQAWKPVVWRDVLLLNGQADGERYSSSAFEKQLHDDKFEPSGEWKRLKQTYFQLCRLYNAAGFSDLILRARDALTENLSLNQHQYFIVDEYQDFNIAEERLLNQITDGADGTLVVGDDDQVLYEKLKSGKASLIRSIYRDQRVVNAMLAFCGRCDFHITRAAAHFIKQESDPDSIKKIFLPMAEAERSLKVQVIGCSVPRAAVDYIRKFVEEHAAEIEQRKSDLAAAKEKDAYLLILSPSGAVRFFRTGDANKELFDLLAPYAAARDAFSEDYYRVLSYYSLANRPSDNFTFRRVLHYEGVSEDDLFAVLELCITENRSFASTEADCAKKALAKAAEVKSIVESSRTIDEKISALAKYVTISDAQRLRSDMEKGGLDKGRAEAMEHQEEEDAELAEIGAKPIGAVELMTIVGSKGLSAEHVIVIGFDNVNMGWVSRNAFFVAMTRARKSLHLITALKSGGAVRPHEYLERLPDRHLEYSRYTLGTRARQGFAGRGQFLNYLRKLNTQSRRK